MRVTVVLAAMLLGCVQVPDLRVEDAVAELDSHCEQKLKIIAAPRLQQAGVVERVDLGDWHDIFVLSDSDNIILRRGATLYELDAGASGQPEELGNFTAARNSRFLFAGTHASATWLFFDANTSVPFALNLETGKMVPFDIPGLTIPGSHAPGIQGWVLAEWLGGVVLMISGGDKASWPRDGNRPVYFWFDLKSGQSVQMPIGYDLYYLSADQTVAIFDKPFLEKFKPRGQAAIDIATGEELREVPDKNTNRFSDWFWPGNLVQSIRMPTSASQRRTGPDREDIVGLSIPGNTWSLKSHFESDRYLVSPLMHDGWIAFRLAKEGGISVTPAELYCGQINHEIKLKQMSKRAVDFKLLDKGWCVYVQDGYGEKGDSHEAFVGNPINETRWNVLDGIERLPAIAPDVAKQPYIKDQMRVRLVQSFGSANVPRQVLCLFAQKQQDLRSIVYPSTANDRVPFRIGRQAVLAGTGERRVQLDVLNGKEQPDTILLHATGRLYLGYNAQSSGEGENKAIKLHRVKLDIEQNESI